MKIAIRMGRIGSTTIPPSPEAMAGAQDDDHDKDGEDWDQRRSRQRSRRRRRLWRATKMGRNHFILKSGIRHSSVAHRRIGGVEVFPQIRVAVLVRVFEGVAAVGRGGNGACRAAFGDKLQHFPVAVREFVPCLRPRPPFCPGGAPPVPAVGHPGHRKANPRATVRTASSSSS